MHKDELLHTARQYQKSNFKSTQFRRAYRSYCNKVELVQPDTFKKLVSDTSANVVQLETFKNRQNKDEELNTFIKSFVNQHSRTRGEN